MIDETLEESASLYALGLLSSEDAAHFETQSRRDPELLSLVRELQDSAARLAHLAPPKEPPARVRSELLAAIQGRKAATQPAGSMRWLPWAIAAGFALLAGFLGFDRQRLAGLVAELRGKDAVAQQEIEALRKQDELSKLRIATLAALPGNAADSAGSVAWDGEKQRGIITLQKLPPPGPAQDYQLWVIDSHYAQPVSGGVVHVDERGNARLTFTVDMPIRVADKFAVSRERKGGVASREGPIVLLGQ
jgi:anti-sigma-K factor RskA